MRTDRSMPSPIPTSIPISIEDQLRELHAPRVEPPPASTRAEAEALLAWAERHDQALAPARSGAFAWLQVFARHPVAVAFAALFVVVFGACVLPTSYEIPLGLSVEIRAADGEQLPVHEIAGYVHERSAAAQVEVMAREVVRDGGQPSGELSIRLWDQNLALGELEPELRERFPALASAEIIETALEGELETIWGRRLAHHALRLPPREVDIEHARQALLVQLHTRGFSDDEVVVKVRDRADGHREVEVQIHSESLGDHPLSDDPGFRWVMDPNARHGEHVELDAPPAGKVVRIHVGGDGHDHQP